jgi:RNA polymerase sigma factor (TIGR02999 family)
MTSPGGSNLSLPTQPTLTELLVSAQSGDQAAWSKALPLVYGELRRISATHMRREHAGHVLQPTALVHEMWLKLLRTPGLSFESRSHFLSICSRLLRQIHIDHARHDAHANVSLSSAAPVDLVALNAAMADLEKLSARQCCVVEMRYFGGMTIEEIAAALHASPRTVKREWVAARAWLHNYLFG